MSDSVTEDRLVDAKPAPILPPLPPIVVSVLPPPRRPDWGRRWFDRAAARAAQQPQAGRLRRGEIDAGRD